MADATIPITFGTIATAAATSVAPSNPVPDNCHTVILRNKSDVVGESILFGIAVVNGAAALVNGTSGEELVPGGSVTLALGQLRERGSMDPADGALGIVYSSLAGTPSVAVIYLSQTGGVRGPLG